MTLSQVSATGSAFEVYATAILSNGFGGSVIDMLDMSDIVLLMDAMNISGAHKLVLKVSITAWKTNPDLAFQSLAAVKVRRASVAKGHALMRIELLNTG